MKRVDELIFAWIALLLRLCAYVSTIPFWRLRMAEKMHGNYAMPITASNIEPTTQQVGRMPGLPKCVVVIA